MAFDRHMNLVIAEAEEYRILKSKKGQGLTEEKQEKRTLGLIILRGDTIVSMTIEGPPPVEQDEKLTPGGPGVAKAAGRGLPVAPVVGAPMGLAGPIRGVGGPVPAAMQPPIMPGMARPPPPPGVGLPGVPPRGFPLGVPPPPRRIPGLGAPMPPGFAPPRG